MMKPPAYWQNDPQKPGLIERLTSPLGDLYGDAVAKKLANTDGQRVAAPVICVGNITMGGVGKTPFTAYLAAQLQEKGRKPAILMRGYGGRLKGPVAVTDIHRAADVGDEALLLRRTAPVIVSADRPAGAALAFDQGADVVVMDDGFQNPSLHKDLSFVVIDAKAGLGNQRVFPAGPLRERAVDGLARADAVLLIGDDGAENAHRRFGIPLDKVVLTARLTTDVQSLNLNQPVIAFAGIGRPEKFFDGLEAGGINVLSRHPFPDHHPYREADIRRLIAEAKNAGATLVTTEKDAVRLPSIVQHEVIAVPALLHLNDPEKLDPLLDQAIAQTKGP